jgi:hypothetical protein
VAVEMSSTGQPSAKKPRDDSHLARPPLCLGAKFYNRLELEVIDDTKDSLAVVLCLTEDVGSHPVRLDPDRKVWIQVVVDPAT